MISNIQLLSKRNTNFKTQEEYHEDHTHYFMLCSESAKKKSLEEITMLGIYELEECGERGAARESPTVGLEKQKSERTVQL